jgi:hypothetical protein
MLHTIELPNRDMSEIDEEHHQISGYCYLCLNLFKGGNIVVREELVDGEMPRFTIVDVTDVVEHIGDPWIRKTAIGFAHWDADVDNFDDPESIFASDASMCFGMSELLRWNDVELTPKVCRALTIDRLREAFKHVYVCAWCPLDI